MGRAYNRNGQKRNAFRLLVGMPEEKSPLGRSRLRRVDIIKMDIGDITWGGVVWLTIGTRREFL
jgi:hypothetical protein